MLSQSIDSKKEYSLFPQQFHACCAWPEFSVTIGHLALPRRASEHAARMVAMKNATENGNQLVTDLTFAFNQLRQGAITQEIAEISAGRIALSGQ